MGNHCNRAINEASDEFDSYINKLDFNEKYFQNNMLNSQKSTFLSIMNDIKKNKKCHDIKWIISKLKSESNSLRNTQPLAQIIQEVINRLRIVEMEEKLKQQHANTTSYGGSIKKTYIRTNNKHTDNKGVVRVIYTNNRVEYVKKLSKKTGKFYYSKI